MSNSDHARILAEHDGILIGLDRLQLIARADPGELAETRFRRLMEHDTVLLQGLLLSHFNFEEEGGYMSDVLKTHPELSPRVAELAAQHDQMRTRLARLLDGLARGEFMTLRAEVLELVDLCRTHERQETDLLMQSVTVDYGVAD